MQYWKNFPWLGDFLVVFPPCFCLCCCFCLFVRKYFLLLLFFSGIETAFAIKSPVSKVANLHTYMHKCTLYACMYISMYVRSYACIHNIPLRMFVFKPLRAFYLFIFYWFSSLTLKLSFKFQTHSLAHTDAAVAPTLRLQRLGTWQISGSDQGKSERTHSHTIYDLTNKWISTNSETRQ